MSHSRNGVSHTTTFKPEVTLSVTSVTRASNPEERAFLQNGKYVPHPQVSVNLWMVLRGG